MSEIMDLVVIEKKNAMAVFTNNDQLDPLIEAIEKEARSLVPDVTTKKGRDAIASMAHKVARSKTYIDNAGKDLVAELKALPKQIDESRRVVRERLDALKDEVRRPLTEWEAEQARIAEEKAAEEERLRIAREEEIKRQAEEKAKREAAEQAQREIDAAAAREREAILAKERAEREQREAAERAEREKQAAVEAERRKAQEEADRIRREAEQRELARLAEEKRKAEEESRRAADVEHRRGINTAAVQALINQGIPHEWAKACIIAVALGKVPATTIKY